MAKPLGIVAMLVLLVASGTASAGDRFVTKNLKLWGVTDSGNLYFETKRGEKYIAEIEHCPVNTLKEVSHSPIEDLKNMDNPRAWFDTDYWFTDVNTPSRTFVVSDGRNGQIKCLTGSLAKI